MYTVSSFCGPLVDVRERTRGCVGSLSWLQPIPQSPRHEGGIVLQVSTTVQVVLLNYTRLWFEGIVVDDKCSELNVLPLLSIFIETNT